MITSRDLVKKIQALLVFLFLVNVAACASGQVEDNTSKANVNVNVNNDVKPLKTDNAAAAVKNTGSKKYSEYLVDIKSYSTNGSYYQNKYEPLLLAMAGEILESQDLDVSKESIGFYYDKKSNRRDRLFLGVDINVARDSSLDYGRFSVKLIKENLGGIIESMSRCQMIQIENEIYGIVVGFKWVENGNSQLVNIWIKKEDLHLYYEGKITLNEMYQRGTITNSTGKIILLPI